METLAETIVKRLTLSRYLFHLGSDHASMHRGVAAFACINMLQDAVEIFLLAAAEHVGVKIARRTEFEQYLDLINEKIAPDELPFRRRLIEINKVRVLSKHDGIGPNATELSGYVGHARDFFEQACRQIFDHDFWSVSLIELLNDGEKKELLVEAERRFDDGDYEL